MVRGAGEGNRRITFYSVFQRCDGLEALFRPGLCDAELRLEVTPEQGEALRAVPSCPVCVVAEVERDDRGRIVRGMLRDLLGY